MTSEALYNTRILRLAASIPHHERLADAQASVTRVSPICGSKVTVDVALDDGGRVARFGQEVRACALGQASASILGSHVLGRSADELAQARDTLAAFLVDSADLAAGWEDLAVFAPARAHRARHPSILLAFDAALAAARDAQAR